MALVTSEVSAAAKSNNLPDNMRTRPATFVVTFILGLMTSTSATAQEVVDGFLGKVLRAADGSMLPYRLFLPDAAARARPLPLIVYLHGGGGAGRDNLKQISGGNTNGTHVWTGPEIQRRHPAFVVAPQLPDDEQWAAPALDRLAPYSALVIELLASLAKEFRIDPDRIYLTGQSRGGRGTWDIISKRPELFAAAVPLCGDGDSSRVRAARHLPIWAFHGAKDETIPVAGSRELVAALRAAGSTVRYTEYPDVGHNVWTVAYLERELPDWLFQQRRSKH
jgi:predicted peptidase